MHPDSNEYKGEVIRLDINPDVLPDMVWDLRKHPLPFKTEEFDEIHAYHILEHLAQQGDYEFFFREWNEYHRILRNDGGFYGVVPSVKGRWAWGDPGHTRVFPEEYLSFLDQRMYKDIDDTNPVSDYRYLYKGDFRKIFIEDDGDSMAFVLRVIK
jgi:SAM-dependent methyltransferase